MDPAERRTFLNGLIGYKTFSSRHGRGEIWLIAIILWMEEEEGGVVSARPYIAAPFIPTFSAKIPEGCRAEAAPLRGDILNRNYLET